MATALALSRRTLLRAALAGSATRLLGCVQPELRTMAGHPMQYYLSLPSSWTRGGSYPVLVLVDGAEHDFAGDFSEFFSARGALPFIIAAPLTVSNASPYGTLTHTDYPMYDARVWDAVTAAGIERFDDEGLAAMVRDIGQLYGGRARVFLTGWSAGGLVTWRTVFMHPERLAAAAPACGNFGGRNVPILADADVSADPQRIALPVRAFQGENDPAFEGLTQQWLAARAFADAHGYANVARQTLPGVDHSPCAREVTAFFATLL